MRALPRYEWQATTAEIARDAGIPESLVERFDHNTSPVPTSWAAAVVARSSSRLNEYPAASYVRIREAAATFADVPVDNVVPGAGIDELILLCGRAFLRPDSSAMTVTPTYPLYRIASAQAGAELVEVSARAPDFSFPADDVVDAAAAADLVWLCIPNNPTGVAPGSDTLASILRAAKGKVVLDAAYAEFAGDEWGPWVREHDNLLVLHTMSKAFGLAGARVGYALGHPDLVAALDGVRPPGSISSLSVDLTVSALSMTDKMQANVADSTRARGDLALDLDSLGFRVVPSATNFVLCEVGPQAPALHKALLGRGLIAGNYAADHPLADFLRFTVRRPPAHRRLIHALERNLQ